MFFSTAASQGWVSATAILGLPKSNRILKPIDTIPFYQKNTQEGDTNLSSDPKGASYTIALWILHTYLMIAIHTTPILLISSPQPRCGKSTLMAVLLALCYRALPTSNISPSAIFRSIEKWGPTLLIDEADSFMRHNDELRGIINSGHTRATAHVIRCDGDDHEPKLFSTWAPKAIAGIGRQAQTIEDRSIEIAMRRRLPTETVERFRMDRIGEFSDLNRQCVRWAIDHEDKIRERDPDVPDFLDDRAADNWRTLLQIADVAGGDCPTNARKALKLLCGERPEEEESAPILLLRDLKAKLTSSSHDRVTSEDFATGLGKMEDRPWPEWGKQQKPITTVQIAKLLRPFGIRPKSIRNDRSTAKGYLLAECTDAFNRYLPPNPPTPPDPPPPDEPDENLNPAEPSPSRSVTPKQPSNGAGMSDFQSVTPRPHVTDENTRKPSNGADCYAVTDHNEGLVEKRNSESSTEWEEEF